MILFCGGFREGLIGHFLFMMEIILYEINNSLNSENTVELNLMSWDKKHYI